MGGDQVPHPETTLTLDLLAYVFDDLPDLPAGPSNTFLNFTFRLVGDSLIMQLVIVGQVADTLLDLSLDLLGFPVELVPIHVGLLSKILQDSVPHLPSTTLKAHQ
jgi:hypothetical protein